MDSVFGRLCSLDVAFNNVYTLTYKDFGTTLEKSCTEPIKPSIKNVIFNNPATIVYWNDGTKTVVKCQKGDTYSKETGLAMAIAKKLYGNNGGYNDVFRKWIKD